MEHFPDAKVMICGGHAGKKQLEKLQKMKSFTAALMNQERIGSEAPNCATNSIGCAYHVE